MEKSKARQTGLLARRQLFEESTRHKQYSVTACGILCDYLSDCTNPILFYYPIKDELDVLYAIQSLKAKKEIYLPKVEGNELVFYQYTDDSDLIQGYMNIPEPSGQTKSLKAHDGICIVPGLCFDKKGARTGYGKGYYDRFFSKNDSLERIGMCFDCQLTDDIETDEYDVSMHKIITEMGLREVKNES